MKICIVSPKNKTVFNFRGDLIKKMIHEGHEVIVTGPNKDFIDDIMKLGVSKFIEVPLRKDKVSFRGDLEYCNRLKQIFKSEKVDLVFSYTAKPSIYSCIAGGKAKVGKIYPMTTGLGRVFSSRSLKSRVLGFLMGRLYKKAFGYASKVIFQNNDDLELFVKLGYVPREKAVKVDGSGVNMSRFHCPDKLSDDHCFLMISRIIKEKGVFEFAEAAKQVKKRYPQARFILLGGYDQSIGSIQPSELAPYVDEGTLEIPGEVKDVLPILSNVRYLVLPTYYYEGVPRVILEAMAMGLPILTTDWRGCREAVTDGFNGFLVPPRDSQALAQKMIEMIENKELTEEMGRNSLKRCREVYDVDIVNKRMFEIMEL